MTSSKNTVLFHSIIQRLLIIQLSNIRQQECYCVTDELKCHNVITYAQNIRLSL